MIVDARQVHRARTELFETGGVSEPLSRAVRPEILASWRRSAAFGAQSNVSSLPHQDDLPASTRLLEAAAPVLRALAASLSGLHAGVLLADRDANIVQRWVADPSILRDLDRICSDAGFGAPEHCVGTNGIGTVAELGRAQMVVGPEHFADALVPFTCVGAPIFSPTTRRREGIVTLSCKAEAANALLTPLMISTAADIENRLLMSATLDERRVLDAYIAAKRERGLVAAIGKDLLIAGAKVTRMLDQLLDRDVVWDVVSELVTSAHPTRHMLPTRAGDVVGVMCSAIQDEGRLIGAIISLDDAVHHNATEQPRRRPQPSRRLPLAGESPRWIDAMEAAARFADERTPVVIVGAPGVGKWTIAREMVGSDFDLLTTVRIDCADLDDTAPFDTRLQVGTPIDLVLLRHIDAASQSVLRELSAWIDERWSAGTRRFVATCSSRDGTLSAEQRRLVERFRGIVLAVPDLHDRPDDIPVVARALLSCHPRGHMMYFSAASLGELSRATWPGNIRQLDDVIRSVAASRSGEITVADLPIEVRSRSAWRSLSTIDQLECDAIMGALQQADGNKVVAARMIGLSRSTIYRKIRAYGLDRDAAFF